MRRIGGQGRVRSGAQRLGQDAFKRRLGRFLPLTILLVLLWGIVLPYQAGVQIDKSLAVWTHHHAGWQLTRQQVSAYDRRYLIRWAGASDLPPILATLEVRNRPIGWPTGAGGRQWGWATFTLALDKTSPVQFTRWPDAPWAWRGLVGWLGALTLDLPTMSSESGSGQIEYDPRRGRWRGVIDLPAWRLTAPGYTWRFGRSSIDIDLRVDDGAPTVMDSILPYGWLLGEVGVDIHRLGWVGPTDRALIDGFHMRLRQVSSTQADLRDVIGSVSVRSVLYGGTPWGGVQTTFGLFGARPDTLGHLLVLGRMLAPTLPMTQRGHVAPAGLDEAHGRFHEAFSALLSALDQAEVHLDAFRFHGPQGGFMVAGNASGPHHRDDEIHPAHPGGRTWRAALTVQMDDRWLRACPPSMAADWLAWLHHRQARWVGQIEYGAGGWGMPSAPADISTFQPQD